MIKHFILIILFVIFSATPSIAADSDCQPLYGGGDSGCSNHSDSQSNSASLSITKEVMKPGKGGDFVKTLNASDPKFAPDDQIIFRLTLKNTGNQSIPKITVVDTLPKYIDLVTAQGTYDREKRTLTYQADNLESGKPQVFYITAKAAGIQTLPSDKSVICVSNQAQATDNLGKSSKDSAQACIQRPGPTSTVTPIPTKTQSKTNPTPKPTSPPSRLPTPVVYTNPNIKQTPPTGPEMAVLPLLGATGLAGYFLRRRTKI